MSKCIEKPGKFPFSTYECPVCHNTYPSKGSCCSHVYKKHREWAYKDSEKNLKDLKNELNRRNK